MHKQSPMAQPNYLSARFYELFLAFLFHHTENTNTATSFPWPVFPGDLSLIDTWCTSLFLAGVGLHILRFPWIPCSPTPAMDLHHPVHSKKKILRQWTLRGPVGMNQVKISQLFVLQLQLAALSNTTMQIHPSSLICVHHVEWLIIILHDHLD